MEAGGGAGALGARAAPAWGEPLEPLPANNGQDAQCARPTGPGAAAAGGGGGAFATPGGAFFGPPARAWAAVAFDSRGAEERARLIAASLPAPARAPPRDAVGGPGGVRFLVVTPAREAERWVRFTVSSVRAQDYPAWRMVRPPPFPLPPTVLPTVHPSVASNPPARGTPAPPSPPRPAPRLCVCARVTRSARGQVVVDDASADATAAAAREAAGGDPRVTVGALFSREAPPRDAGSPAQPSSGPKAPPAARRGADGGRSQVVRNAARRGALANLLAAVELAAPADDEAQPAPPPPRGAGVRGLTSRSDTQPQKLTTPKVECAGAGAAGGGGAGRRRLARARASARAAPLLIRAARVGLRPRAAVDRAPAGVARSLWLVASAPGAVAELDSLGAARGSRTEPLSSFPRVPRPQRASPSPPRAMPRPRLCHAIMLRPRLCHARARP